MIRPSEHTEGPFVSHLPLGALLGCHAILRVDQRSRVVAILAIIVALAAIALELAYTVGAFVLGVVHRVM